MTKPASIVVTGAAGFIGSHTCEVLIKDFGCDVTGIDCFTSYYDRSIKEENLNWLKGQSMFRLVERNLADESYVDLFTDVDAVVHLAAQPGVRDSWDEFDTYVKHNITGTKRVLDTAIEAGVPRVVYASSSSVYGDSPLAPTPESAPLDPRSPYGVTKLTGERLCTAYSYERGLPTVSLRYFTVYGPRQRPDMAAQRLIKAGISGDSFTMFGDGLQVRDFTFVGDVARANALAATVPDVKPGEILNVCGGAPVTLSDLVQTVEDAVGKPLNIIRQGASVGDVRETRGDGSRANKVLGWKPEVNLTDGVKAQVANLT